MENNLFENAKFGDKFITQYDKNPFVIFLHTGYQSHESEEIDEYRCIIVINEIFIFLCYDKNGICLNADSKYNIVSRYQESVDEDKLDELAYECSTSLYGFDNDYENNRQDVEYGYKAAYYKVSNNSYGKD